MGVTLIKYYSTEIQGFLKQQVKKEINSPVN